MGLGIFYAMKAKADGDARDAVEMTNDTEPDRMGSGGFLEAPLRAGCHSKRNGWCGKGSAEFGWGIPTTISLLATASK